jgi:diguanylate cyclase (GGDEF)-like protein
VGQGFAVETLRRTFAEYLRTLGRGLDEAGYFEGRLRVGLVHARVGVPPALYQAAYVKLQQILIGIIPPGADRDALASHVLRVTTLDMSLAIETYHLSKLERLEESVQRHRSESRMLRHRARTDSLTGLPNRARILFELEQAIEQARVDGSTVCVVMADLDRFKAVNDRYGHEAGDRVLRQVSANLTAAIRAQDIVLRWGGEEFVVLMPNTDEAGARKALLRLAERGIGQRPDGSPQTACVGIAERGRDRAKDWTKLLEIADERMYAAKDAGRNAWIDSRELPSAFIPLRRARPAAETACPGLDPGPAGASEIEPAPAPAGPGLGASASRAAALAAQSIRVA